MNSTLDQLVREIKDKKIKRNKKDVKFKILTGLLYFFGLSLRKTSRFISI